MDKNYEDNNILELEIEEIEETQEFEAVTDEFIGEDYETAETHFELLMAARYLLNDWNPIYSRVF